MDVSLWRPLFYPLNVAAFFFFFFDDDDDFLNITSNGH